MAPTTKVTREAIVEEAFSLVREKGVAFLTAREIASRLKVSTQPIFSNFSSMEMIRKEVAERAYGYYRDFQRKAMEEAEALSGVSPYKASGMAYIDFAREEKELFRLLFMSDFIDEKKTESEEFSFFSQVVGEKTGFDDERARRFHLEMWVFVHGAAVMEATGYMSLDRELVSKMLSDVYKGVSMKMMG